MDDYETLGSIEPDSDLVGISGCETVGGDAVGVVFEMCGERGEMGAEVRCRLVVVEWEEKAPPPRATSIARIFFEL